jgi:hypothetical protein
VNVLNCNDVITGRGVFTPNRNAATASSPPSPVAVSVNICGLSTVTEKHRLADGDTAANGGSSLTFTAFTTP